MKNTITIWRPFLELEESVMSLEINDLRLLKSHLADVIKEFMYGLEDEDMPLTEKNQSIQYYWNNGKPFLYDLVEYYRLACWHNVNEGGDDYDYFDEDWWEYIEDSEFRVNESTWKEEHSLVHLIALMERNYFWYKRYGMAYKNFKFKNNTIYSQKGEPRSIKVNQIDNQCYIVERR